jgi:hypothetical protein
MKRPRTKRALFFLAAAIASMMMIAETALAGWRSP